MNYKIDNKEKKAIKNILIIFLIIMLVAYFRPLSWLKKQLYLKSLHYKSTHTPVTLNSFKAVEEKLPFEGTIISNGSGLDIKPNSSPTDVKIIDIGVVDSVGYNEIEKNYIKVRHIFPYNKDIIYSYYSNLPDTINLSENQWVSSSTIIYSGYNLDYLHFEILDFDGNNLNPKEYINIE